MYVYQKNGIFLAIVLWKWRYVEIVFPDNI